MLLHGYNLLITGYKHPMCFPTAYIQLRDLVSKADLFITNISVYMFYTSYN